MDISHWIDKKVEVNLANKTEGAAGDNGARLRSRLAAQKLRLPILGDNDEIANREYIKHFVLDQDSQGFSGVYPRTGKSAAPTVSRPWAEAFHYIGPVQSMLDHYIAEHAVPL